MSTFERVEDNLDYKKDTATGVIVNDNSSEYHNARIRAGKAKESESRLSTMEDNITTIMKLIRNMSDGTGSN